MPDVITLQFAGVSNIQMHSPGALLGHENCPCINHHITACQHLCKVASKDTDIKSEKGKWMARERERNDNMDAYRWD